MVDAESEHVECYWRRDGEWIVHAYEGLEAVCRLESLDSEILLSRVYQKVTWLD